MRLVVCLALAVVATGSGAAGTAPQGSDVAPKVSPSGRYLLYRRVYPGSRYTPAPQALIVTNADGGAERVLVGTTPRRFGASWGPGGLVSVTREGRTELMRPEDGVVVGTLPFEDDPTWSPDGRYAAYSAGRRLWIANADGSGPSAVASSHRLGWVVVGEWSPDSTRVTYVKDLSIAERAASEVVRADGTGRRRLKAAPVVSAGRWSPGGHALVLLAQRDLRRPARYEAPHLFAVRPDGSRLRLITSHHATDGAWSPTGRRIAYVRQIPGRGRSADRWELMIVRPDGSGLRRIARVGYGASPAWFADSRRIVISGRGRCPTLGIYSVDVMRRTVRRLTNRC